MVSSRIEVLGFTPVEQRQYFTECLKGDTKALESLLGEIQENTVVQSSCYLPLNAAFIVNIFKFKGHSLPNTEYGIFTTVILNCIYRHFERENRGHDLSVKLASLDDLSRSETVREPFHRLCERAYHGVMVNKVTFSSIDLPQGFNTLSLLQGIESFLQSGKSVYYAFLHLSLQELLAAYYMATCLSDGEQVSQFQQLFDQPRFSVVFQFYAAITKLKTPGIYEIIARIVKGKSKPLLVSLLHCLHEAQDPSLCQFVAERLDRYGLNLKETSLSPSDCLFIGYFLSTSSVHVVNSIRLDACCIGDQGVRTLTKYMSKSNNPCGWRIRMKSNNIHEEGAASIAAILRTSSILSSLDLHYNPIGGNGLLAISEALIANSSLRKLRLSHCSLVITEENGPVLTEMLQRNKTLTELVLWDNPGVSDTGAFFIAEGVEKNTALKVLNLGECGIGVQGGKTCAIAIVKNSYLPLIELDLSNLEITEENGPSFVDMLQKNTSLEELVFYDSPGVSDTGVSFIAEGLQKNTKLRRLRLDKCKLTSKGAKDLSIMVAMNMSLKELNINGNRIRDDGITHLAEALKQNKTLETLRVASCGITDVGVISLAGALHTNHSLDLLDLYGNEALSEYGVTCLSNVISRMSNKVYLLLPEHLMTLV